MEWALERESRGSLSALGLRFCQTKSPLDIDVRTYRLRTFASHPHPGGVSDMGYQFGAVLALAAVAIGFAAALLTLFRIIRPDFPEPTRR